MNPIDFCINEIKNQIPIELLISAMNFDEPVEIVNMSTLEDKILNKVFKKRILLAANIIGGIEMLIPLASIPPSMYEYSYTVYPISPNLIMDKEIMSVHGLSYMPGNGFMGLTGGFAGVGNMFSPNTPDYYSMNPVMNVANRIGSAAGMSGVLTNAHTELVSHNTVAVYANYRTLANFGLRVVLENDNNLSNIQPRSFLPLSILTVHAVKAYIYNKLIIPVNSGYLSGGQDLGIFKSILESYSDSEENYRTYLNEVWGAIAYMNDTTRYNSLLQSMCQPDI